jgi:hypothetical protein
MENMDDFEFESFMDGSNSDFERKVEAFREEMIQKAIEANYDVIANKGISDWHIRQMNDIEQADLKMTLEKMIAYYEELEMYERCALLVKYLHNVMEHIHEVCD